MGFDGLELRVRYVLARRTVVGMGLLPSDWQSGSICRLDEDLLDNDSGTLGSFGVQCLRAWRRSQRRRQMFGVHG